MYSATYKMICVKWLLEWRQVWDRNKREKERTKERKKERIVSLRYKSSDQIHLPYYYYSIDFNENMNESVNIHSYIHSYTKMFKILFIWTETRANPFAYVAIAHQTRILLDFQLHLTWTFFSILTFLSFL